MNGNLKYHFVNKGRACALLQNTCEDKNDKICSLCAAWDTTDLPFQTLSFPDFCDIFLSQIYFSNCYFPVPYLMLLLKCQQITRFDLPIFSCSMQALTSNLIHCIISTIASRKVITHSTSPSSSVLTAEFQTQILNCLLYRMHFKRIWFFIHRQILNWMYL